MTGYAIGAAFLLAALMMYGTLGGFLPRIVRGSKYGALAAFALLCLAAALYWRPELPDLQSLLPSSRASAPPAPTPLIPPPPTAKAAPRVRHSAAVVRQEEDRIPPAEVSRPDIPPEEPDASELAPEAAPVLVKREPQAPALIVRPPPPEDGRVKKAVKAVGRFFRKAADQ
jgi:hypothetical protein